MTDLDALLAGIVANPHEAVRWLIVADWLDDHGQPERAELLRLHRMLIDTGLEPDSHPDRADWLARVVELIDQGVKPCLPRQMLVLPGRVPLVGCFIPPGMFRMGSPDFRMNLVRRVNVPKGFFLGATPVTQEQWRAVMGTDPSQFKGDKKPVDSVTWREAVAFCDRLSAICGRTVRLPLEDEWEYACRAGTTTNFHFGDKATPARMRYDSGAVSGVPDDPADPGGALDVGRYPPNPWGLFDCHGGVREWCLDQYREFLPTRPTLRACRGGSWRSVAWDCRSAAPTGSEQDDGSPALGFRVAFG